MVQHFDFGILGDFFVVDTAAFVGGCGWGYGTCAFFSDEKNYAKEKID